MRHVHPMFSVAAFLIVLFSASLVGDGTLDRRTGQGAPTDGTARQGSNLIANAGFETDPRSTADGWRITDNVRWSGEVVRSGERALHGSAEQGSSRATSNFLAVPANERIEVSAWVKTRSVVDRGRTRNLRLTVSAYERNQIDRIRHWDIATPEGSTDWTEYRGTIIAPPGTAYVNFSVQLTDTTGEFFLDDVSIEIAQTIPAVDLGTLCPSIVPSPVVLVSDRQRATLGHMLVHVGPTEHHLRNAMVTYFADSDLPYTLLEPGEEIEPDGSFLIAGDRSIRALSRRFQERFPHRSWADLGDQGYFLSIEETPSGVAVYLGANSEQGRFYAFQSFMQLVDLSSASVVLAAAVDWPALERRGVMMPIHWYNPWHGHRDEVFGRLAELKLNFVWNQGSFVNEKFRFRWREPLSDREQADLEAYLQLAERAFIHPYISVSPKVEGLSDPPIFSSERDIDSVVAKFEDLYGLGFRNFGLSFDDQYNYDLDRLYGEDRDFFGDDIGSAHRYFVSEVYHRLRSVHPDIRFMVVPMKYSNFGDMGDRQHAYLRELAKLPQEIELFSAVEYPGSASNVVAITERRHTMMDNFYARHYREPAPEFVLPVDRAVELTRSHVTGYAFLPMLPDGEDASLTSWSTAAEFAWLGARYHPEEAFQRSASRYLHEAHGCDATSNVSPSRPLSPPERGAVDGERATSN